jgi:uncharacterized membrane protein YfcA
MAEWLLVGLAGFFAAMVDGSLGMGFGPTSSSILLSTGLSPAATSTTVNLAKVAGGLAAAISHWRFQNIDRRLVFRLAIPGVFGALIGTSVLANVDGDDLRPILALLLLLVGLRIFVRFSRRLPVSAADPTSTAKIPSDVSLIGTEVAGLAGGTTNGLVGAWGPVVTPFLLHRGVPPRYAVGCVNTAEVAVAIVAAGSLLTSMNGEGVEAATVIAMLVGSVAAAPIAAWVVKFFPPRLMGLAVAGLLLITQTRELSNWRWPTLRWYGYVIVPIALVAAAFRPRIEDRRRQRASVS